MAKANYKKVPATPKSSIGDPAAKSDGSSAEEANAPLSSVDRVKKDYDSFHAYINSRWDHWQQLWDLWNNKRVRKQYKSKIGEVFDPMVHQIVETIVDNVYGSRPKFTYLPTRKDQETDTKLINGMLDFSWDKSDMDRKVPVMGREGTLLGNFMTFVDGWKDGYMDLKHVPLRDCIFDVTAADPTQFKFAGYRRLAMIDDLKKEKRFDPTQGEKGEDGKPQGAWVPRYKNLDDIKGAGGRSGELTDTELKEQMYAGSTLPKGEQGNQVEVMYMHYVDKVVEIANRDQVIFEEANPYQKASYKAKVQLRNEQAEPLYNENKLPAGAELMTQDELEEKLQPEEIEITVPAIEPFIPVIMHREEVDPAMLIAKSTIASIMDTQEQLNDWVAFKRDNAVQAVQNVALIDEGSKDAIPKLQQATPGAIIPIKNLSSYGKDKVIAWMDKPDFTRAADVEIDRMKKVIRDTARVGETAQGVDTDNTNRTATEIQAQMAQATGGFTTKVRSLECGFYKQYGEIFFKCLQIFVTEEQMVRVLGKNGAEFRNFQPDKYWGPYDVKVVLEERAKAEQRAQADKTLKAYALFKDDQDFNQLELKKKVAKQAFDMDEDDLDLLMNPHPDNAALMGGQVVPDAAAGGPALSGGGLAPAPAPTLVPQATQPPVSQNARPMIEALR